jgi:uncharacterized protein involved in type VI secretion and phage assembly
MSGIVNIVQKIVQHELRKIRIGEIGVVTSIFAHTSEDDDNNYECNVRLKNSNAKGAALELRKVPIATGLIGNAALPNIGDLVVVSFVQGNVNQPIITGRLYNDEDRPPIHNPNEIIHRLPFSAEDTETVKLDLRNIADNDPPRELMLEMPAKIKIQVNDHQVLTQVDQTKITVIQKGDDDGTITIESGKSRVTISQDGDIQVQSEGDLALTANGDMQLQAPNINIKSDQELKIEAGTNGTFKAGAQAKIEAGATMDIKGAMVNIN